MSDRVCDLPEALVADVPLGVKFHPLPVCRLLLVKSVVSRAYNGLERAGMTDVS